MPSSSAFLPLLFSLLFSTTAVQARGLTPDLAADIPRMRLSSLPFPSLLYDRVDARYSLGDHHYIPFQRMAPPRGSLEVSRGTLYTKRAGFLDIGHIRKTIDWTAYVAWHTEAALRAGKSTMAWRFYEPSLYRASFNYPPSWNSLSPEEKNRIIPELALRSGQHVAYVALTWHEIITWYGYKSTLVIPEQSSAFCFDDVISHLVGIKVAAEAIRDPARPYNEAVTHALNREILAAGPVADADQSLILDSVKNNWWNFGDSLKRFLDIGYPVGEVTPWLVNDTPFNSTPAPLTYSLPPLADIHGHDFSQFLHIRIDPRVFQKRKILQTLPPGTKTISPAEHFPLIMDTIKTEAEMKFGPYTAQPYPPNPSPDLAPETTPVSPARFPFSPRNRSTFWRTK